MFKVHPTLHRLQRCMSNFDMRIILRSKTRLAKELQPIYLSKKSRLGRVGTEAQQGRLTTKLNALLYKNPLSWRLKVTAEWT